MAIKFSQLPKVSVVDSNSLIPVVTVGMSSNVMGVATATVLGTFVATAMSATVAVLQGNIATLQSNAAAQDTSINTLNSTVSSQGSTLSIHTGQISSLLTSKATVASPTFTGTTTVATLTTGNIAPAANIASNIGSTGLRYNWVFARTTSASSADLAEKYLPDAEYPTGTVVMIGGDAEITACQPNARAIGAISADPAYQMNSDLEGGVYVALKGRVPVFVAGPVRKGQDLVADTCGCAVANSDLVGGKVFAVALETNDDAGIKLVEALIL